MTDAGADFSAFAHLGAPKSAGYRRVLDAFTRRRASFTLQLRPAEVLAELAADGGPAEGEDEVAALLAQLAAWGNLERLADDTRVTTIEQFRRLGSLYSLSAEGLAAEKALEHFRAVIGDEGSLDRRVLRTILDRLAELEALLAVPPAELDHDKAREAFDRLAGAFDSLAREAREFLLNLQGAIDLQRLDVQAFLSYKHWLLGYLRDFIQELGQTTPRVRAALHRLEARPERVRALLDWLGEDDAAHGARPGPEARAAARERRAGQWRGIARWFSAEGGRGGRSRADELADRAVSASAALVSAAAGIGDRRHARIDRGADFKALAAWFLDAPDDEAAHGLWRAVTGLQPARHLRLDAATREAREGQPVPAGTAWADAPPLSLPIRLRATGSFTKRGRGKKVTDRAEARDRLRRRAAAVSAQVEAARRELGTDAAQPLSAYAALSPEAFAELFDLLGAAFSRRTRQRAPVEVHSADGRVTLRLGEPASGNEATLRTRGGTLRGPDFAVEVSASRAGAEAAPAGVPEPAGAAP